VDNVTDAILADYRRSYGSAVSKDDVFYYVYGLLHSPVYRTEFAADLKKMLPRIPKVTDFAGFVRAGRELATLHVGYESVAPYELTETLTSGAAVPDAERYRVQKMSFGRGKDRSTIIYNAHLTLSGIPEAAYRYMLGSRSAIEWIIDRYQVSTRKDSGIRNDPNDWSEDPRYIVDLLKRIVTVSIDTMKIVDALPALEALRS
jgi:predicted helicase